MTLQKTPARLKAQRPMPEYCSAIENRDRDALDNVFASDAVIEYIVMVRVKRPVQEIRAFLAQSSSRMKVAETRRPSASNTAGLPLRGLGVADVGVEAPVLSKSPGLSVACKSFQSLRFRCRRAVRSLTSGPRFARTRLAAGVFYPAILPMSFCAARGWPPDALCFTPRHPAYLSNAGCANPHT